jgi:hypothetical protein
MNRLLVGLLIAGVGATAGAQTRRTLHDGWSVQSSEKVGVDGHAISSPSYPAGGWNMATVPSTVVGELVEDGVF